MRRIILCLPLCLCLGSDRRAEPPALPTAVVRADVVKDNGGALPTAAEFEKLAKLDPIAFLEAALRRYAREVKGYTLTMQKQERLGGKLHPTEVIEVRFVEKPHSVHFTWIEGARLAERVMYVEGENDGKMLARPRGVAARLVAGDIVSRDVTGPDARQSGRYTLNEFGLKKATERILVSWKKAKEAGDLQVEYQGIQKIKDAGDRPCHVLKRTSKTPENDGVVETTLYVDVETWLQAGAILKDKDGMLIGAYYFRDVRLNPEFKKDAFSRAALKP